MDGTTLVGIIGAAGSFLGALALFRKARKEMGKIQAEEAKTRAESFDIQIEAIRNAYSTALEDQLKNVVAPMERRIDRLNKLVNDLQAEVDELRGYKKQLQEEADRLRGYKTKFELAINYIRQITRWLSENVSDGVKPPALPEELIKDFSDMEKEKA